MWLEDNFFIVEALTKVGVRGYHSEQKLVDQNTMKIRILPALSDNYMYLLMDPATNEAAIIDPVDPESVIKAVEEEGVGLPSSMRIQKFLCQKGEAYNLADHPPPLGSCRWQC